MAYDQRVFEPAVPVLPPTPDLPALTIRWEGLVVAIDATTLNTFARQLIRNVPEVREVLIDPEDGRLRITVRVKKGIPVAFRGEIRDMRVKDGFLGFAIADLRVFRRVPIPNWVVKKIVDMQPPGRAFFYPEDRIVVLKTRPDTPYRNWIAVSTSVQDAGGSITIQREEEKTITVGQ